MLARRNIVLRRIGRAAFRVDDHLPLLEEVIGNADRRVEQTARILAQVENKPLHALLFELVDGFIELANSRRREVFDTDVADARTEHQHIRDRVCWNGRADDRQRNRFLDADAEDLDVDRGALRTLELLHDLVERQLAGRCAFDLRDHIAGADAEAGGGCAFERGDDRDLVIPLRHQDAQAVERALLAILHVRVLFRLEE